MNLYILLGIIFFLLIVLGFLVKDCLKIGKNNAKTANELRYHNSLSIIKNKEVFSKHEIQKAQQFIDSYLDKRL